MLLRLLSFGLILFILSCSTDSDTDNGNNQESITVSDFLLTMDENPENGQVVGTINASTNKGSLSYSISNQQPNGALSLDSRSGVLSVVNKTLFDYEDRQSITAMVKVTNGDVSKSANIVITLADVYEPVVFDGSVFLTHQRQVNVFGREGYTEITGGLSIDGSTSNGNPHILDLSPLSSIVKVEGSLLIKDLTGVTALDGLNNLKYVFGNVTIDENPALENINALNNIEIIGSESNSQYGGSLVISRNQNLISISGFNKIVHLNKHLQISNNDALQNIEGFQKLEDVFSLNIGNPLLTDINAFNTLHTIWEGFILKDNYNLENLNAFSNLQIAHRFTLLRNDSLVHIDSFQSLVEMSSLSISSNDALENINGLSSLNLVSTSLDIKHNKLLTDLCGLRNLLLNDGAPHLFTISNNGYNPSETDIINGDCRI